MSTKLSLSGLLLLLLFVIVSAFNNLCVQTSSRPQLSVGPLNNNDGRISKHALLSMAASNSNQPFRIAKKLISIPIEAIVEVIRNAKDSAYSIYDAVSQTPELVETVKAEVKDTVKILQGIPSSISSTVTTTIDKAAAIPNEVTETVQSITDSTTETVKYAYSNITALPITVESKISDVKSDFRDLKRTVRLTINAPFTFIGEKVEIAKSAIDTFYDQKYQEELKLAKLEERRMEATKARLQKKLDLEKKLGFIEDTKETIYSTIDATVSIYEGTVNTAKAIGEGTTKTVKTIGEIADTISKVPETISKSKQSIDETIIAASKDIEGKKAQLSALGEYAYRVVTLQEAKKVYDETQIKVKNSYEGLVDLKNKVTDPETYNPTNYLPAIFRKNKAQVSRQGQTPKIPEKAPPTLAAPVLKAEVKATPKADRIATIDVASKSTKVGKVLSLMGDIAGKAVAATSVVVEDVSVLKSKIDTRLTELEKREAELKLTQKPIIVSFESTLPGPERSFKAQNIVPPLKEEVVENVSEGVPVETIVQATLIDESSKVTTETLANPAPRNYAISQPQRAEKPIESAEK